ncbi:hypothetical protein [uncultured Arthrobacter sp.]|uniref:hypothetical protein n=1 Tax=uncultured Arthrobacter sp. TaxID=114050 RepID=UPI0028D2965E|nr:hypothetical protein [uncultured Arthrobacter sp.]
MRTSDQIDRAAQARHLQEALLSRVAKGREWATPGVEAALRRALTGIDSGLEAASPRLQASLRTIANELAGRVETATPRLHERIAKLLPVGETPAQAVPAKKTTNVLWGLLPAAVAAVAGAMTMWRVMRSVPEPDIGPAPEAPAGETSITPPSEAAM